MAQHARGNDSEVRAAARSADALLNARNTLRHGGAVPGYHSMYNVGERTDLDGLADMESEAAAPGGAPSSQSEEEDGQPRRRDVRELRGARASRGARNSRGAAEARDTRGLQGSRRMSAARGERDRAAGGARCPSRPEGAQPVASRMTLLDFARRNSTYILSVVGVVAIAVLMLVFVRACAPHGDTGGDAAGDAVGSAYVSPYDWSCLRNDGGRLSYVVNGQVKSRIGVDVSDHQQAIDWNAAASDGIDFAMIRLGYRGSTEGGLYVDEQYEANIAGAQAAGLDCGAYFFSQANTVEEAVEEADFVVENLGGVRLEYPVAFDSEHATLDQGESRIAGLSQEEMTAITKAFCDRVEQAGYRTMVYGATYDLDRYVYDDMAARLLWWAEYSEANPTAPIDIAMWQYTNEGQVAGISTAVDMNLDLSGVLG